MKPQTINTSPEQSTETPTAPSFADFTLPSSLDSTGTKLVYLYLDATNGGDIADLRASLGMKTITLYPILQTLETNGLVKRDGDEYHIAS